MIFRELAPIAPLLIFALAVALGTPPHEILVGFLLAEAAGIGLYVLELRWRFKHNDGQR